MYEREGRNGSLPPEEKQWVAALRGGRSDAFERLVREYGPRIEAVARRMLRDPEGARDVTQEVYIAVFRSIDGFQGRSRFASWVHRIAVNRSLIELRRRRRRLEVALEDDCDFGAPGREAEPQRKPVVVSDPADGPAEHLERLELRRAVRRDLGALARPDREALTLRYLEERPAEEVARHLGLSASAAKSRTHRARARLRERRARRSEPAS